MKKIFLIILLYGTVILPQDIQSDWNYFKTTGKHLFSLNKNVTSSEWITAGLISISTFAAYSYDEEVREIFQKNKTPFLSAIAKIDNYFGDYPTAIPIIGLYIHGIAVKNKSNQYLGLQLITASFYNGLITQTIKMSLGRARPYNNYGKSSFEHFNLSDNSWSFPSGHTSWIFAITKVMAEQKNNLVWKSGWYLLAVTTGLARIYNDKHWLSDVIIGAAIGYAVGSFTVNQFKEQNILSNQNLIIVTIPIF